MINSDVFNYVNVLDKAADGAWMRNQAIAHNIANVDTPGYKRQDVSFEAELKHALKASKYVSLDEKVDHLNQNGLSRINPRTYSDYSGYSYRLDRNNVDIDTENVELASNQLKYNALVQSINEEFNNIKTVLSK
ncbi:MAG: flagellar basal body rod protein FlgB [Lachnospiraceae bacterium]|nr:flagellar basal body rod protein FlgB [Lachnospiraceae bacterium]HAU99864.1 flagellar basal body rod protein FlgB [Lachnospiraceae bacterium]